MLKWLLVAVSAVLFTILGVFLEKPYCLPSPGQVAFDGSTQCKRCAQTLVLDRHGNWEHDKW